MKLTIYNLNVLKKSLDTLMVKYIKLEKKKLIKFVAKKISEGKIVGWFQNRMEFGPRALGARSIIADPRDKSMQKKLNLKIKFRESFRPFAPSVLQDQSNKWFNLDCNSPYMLIVSDLKKDKLITIKKTKKTLSSINEIRSKVPSITHVNNSARVQTVNKSTNPLYYDLIKEFFKITKTPLLINTSFNIRGEPIVCTPEDAYRCFMGTNLDILVLENFIIEKNSQQNKIKINYKNKFNLD